MGMISNQSSISITNCLVIFHCCTALKPLTPREATMAATLTIDGAGEAAAAATLMMMMMMM
jgi:hypothetical protein